MPGARLVSAVVVAFLVGGCGSQRNEPAPAPTGPRLTAKLGRELDKSLRVAANDGGIPGVSAAIVFADGREWRGATGDAVLSPKREMTSDTSLPFDSVTKVATAALALRLAEQGRLRLDDAIRRWYPGWRGDPRASVRDLLGHTAGAPADPRASFYRRVFAHPRRQWTVREVIAAAPPPGVRTSRAEYSNVGFIIAGMILERAAGEPAAELMRRELFSRHAGAGLALQPGERSRAPRAHSYAYPRGWGRGPRDRSDGGPILPFPGWASQVGTAGALAGDVPSLARWGHALLAGRILQTRSLREMTRFHEGGLWEAYGLGLARQTIADHAMWGHGGAGPGSHTEFWHLPREQLTIAVAWNDEQFDKDLQIFPALLRTALRPS